MMIKRSEQRQERHGGMTMAYDFGKCPLCGKGCRDDEEIVQMDAGVQGFIHLDCLQESAEHVVDLEREIERHDAR
jgi:hypothetical protein